MKRLPAIIVTLLVCAATASAQLPRSSAAGREGGRTTLDEMVQTERRFAARARQKAMRLLRHSERREIFVVAYPPVPSFGDAMVSAQTRILIGA